MRWLTETDRKLNLISESQEVSEMLCKSRIRSFLRIAAYLAVIAFALPAGTTYNTFMFRNYQEDWQTSLEDVQWANWDGWNDEMNDIAQCKVCKKNNDLGHYLSYNGEEVVKGHYADLIAVDTHGGASGEGATFYAEFASYSIDQYLDSREMEPTTNRTEIYLLGPCDGFSIYGEDMWYGYRNLFSHGAHIAAGCFGLCADFASSTDSTWDEIGDGLADEEASVWKSWKTGYKEGDFHNDIAVFAIGTEEQGNCDYRSNHISYENKHTGWDEYVYTRDYSWGVGFELCGYYNTMND
jgi:hypothetical protein